MASTNSSPNFMVQTMPGLEAIAWRELHAQFPDASRPTYHTVPGRNGMLLFEYPGSAEDLFRLRCIEDLFAIVMSVDIPWGHEGLDRVYQELTRSMGKLYRALALRDAVQHAPPRHRAEVVRFRVIARLAGGEQPFLRQTLRRSVETAIQKQSHRKWVAVTEQEDAEIWCTVFTDHAIIGLRLGDASMRQRDYKVAHLPASLRPSVAAAMVQLSRPEESDVILDPMCGAGTILIERALMGRYVQLVGLDLDPIAIDAAAQNFGPKHKPRQIMLADARSMPLQDASVTRIISNLPFGKQIARPQDLPALYRRFLAESVRVLRPGGLCVLMTSEANLLQDLAAHHASLYLMETRRLQILGQKAEILVFGSVPA